MDENESGRAELEVVCVIDRIGVQKMEVFSVDWTYCSDEACAE